MKQPMTPRAAAALLAVCALATGAAADGSSKDVLAIRVGRAETISQGTIEHAVILVEDGKITAIGQDLPVDRGIPILDRPSWTAMPGLVHPYSRLGLTGRGDSGFSPHALPTKELYPLNAIYGDLLQRGVTTLSLYPAGNGVPGQSIVLRTDGDERSEMLIKEGAYLKVEFRSDSRSKKTIRDGFSKVDDYIEKEKKAREKWEKAVEKAKKKKSSDKKKDEKDEKDEEKTAAKPDDEKKDDGPGPYVPPEVDEKVQPFMDLREKKLRALVALPGAGEFMHWLDAVGEEGFEWDLRVPMTRQSNLYEVSEELGEKNVRLVMEPEITLQPGTRRQRNLPAELSEAGAKLVLIPRRDSLAAVETWLASVGAIVAAGLDRQVGLRAVTLEPATVLGLQESLGSIDVGKEANLIFFDGDPLERSTRLQAVMLEGRFVKGGVQD